MQKYYIIEKVKDFNIVHILECGQCFRWNKEKDGSYTGIFGNNVLNVKQDDKKVIFKGICDGDIKEVVEKYFDLKTDYGEIKTYLMKRDLVLEPSLKYGEGLRILNQDLWECIASFIISANNNIPRIKKIVENLSKAYGRKIVYEEKEYYTFPTPQELSKASIQDLRNLGLGFRDKRIYETTKSVLNGDIDLEKLKKISNVQEIKDELLKLSGVGEKVADCVILFSLKRYEAFPVDVWVRRVMNQLYIKNEDEKKVSKDEIQKLAREKFGDMAGLAQQYLFYWKREA